MINLDALKTIVIIFFVLLHLFLPHFLMVATPVLLFSTMSPTIFFAIFGFALVFIDFVIIYFLITRKKETEKIYPLIIQYIVPACLLIYISFWYSLVDVLIQMYSKAMSSVGRVPLSIYTYTNVHTIDTSTISLFLMSYLIITAISFSLVTKVVSDKSFLDIKHLISLLVIAITFFLIYKYVIINFFGIFIY